MSDWEYLEAYVYQDEWVDSSGRRKTVGRKIKVRDASVYFTATAALNELGSRGWELVSVGFSDMSLFRLFLKRPKMEEKRFVPIREIESPEQPAARPPRAASTKGVVSLPRPTRETRPTGRPTSAVGEEIPEARAAL